MIIPCCILKHECFQNIPSVSNKSGGKTYHLNLKHNFSLIRILLFFRGTQYIFKHPTCWTWPTQTTEILPGQKTLMIIMYGLACWHFINLQFVLNRVRWSDTFMLSRQNASFFFTLQLKRQLQLLLWVCDLLEPQFFRIWFLGLCLIYTQLIPRMRPCQFRKKYNQFPSFKEEIFNLRRSTFVRLKSSVWYIANGWHHYFYVGEMITDTALIHLNALAYQLNQSSSYCCLFSQYVCCHKPSGQRMKWIWQNRTTEAASVWKDTFVSK